MQPIRVMLVILMCAIAGLAAASTLYVNQAGTDPQSPYTTPATAALTIQDAVDAAAAGDRIEVAPGNYTSTAGDVAFIENKAISLVGAGPDAVVVDGQGARRGIRTLMQSASGDLRIEGLTITNAVTAGSGGGIHARWMGPETGSLTLDNVVITDCQSGSAGGGGLHFDPNLPVSLIVTNCSIRDNRADNGPGGGILIGTKVADTSLIVDSELIGNETGSGSGGGIQVYGPVTLRNTLIAENTAGGHGGGVVSSSGHVTLENCVIRDNYGGYGGGVYVTAQATLIIQRQYCYIYRRNTHDDLFLHHPAGAAGRYGEY
ncbi:MAG: right-handed parallel beta-helix repeat-containing protein [Kiritimatiellia bacterium]